MSTLTLFAYFNFPQGYPSFNHIGLSASNVVLHIMPAYKIFISSALKPFITKAPNPSLEATKRTQNHRFGHSG